MLSVSLLLFFGACLGHLALWVYMHNYWYGLPLPEKLVDNIRLVHFFCIAVFPLALWFGTGLDLLQYFTHEEWSFGEWVFVGYLSVCWLIGFVLFPAITLRRILRPLPAALVENHTQTRDIAQELGHRPVGISKHDFLAKLPYNEIFQVDFAEKTFHLPRLPAAWDGLTILHLSDLHFVGTPDREFYQRVFDHCNAWEPDLIAFTGDLVDKDRLRRWIVPLLGRLRCKLGAFAILGNHDYWFEPELIRRRLRRIRMDVLGNGWRQLEIRGEPLVIIGNEGPWFLPEPDLSKCPEGPFRLLLSHTPDNMKWARRHGVDLMLSGHNHGGQIRLPLFGSVFVPSTFSREYDCGLFYEKPTLLHVCRGLAGEHPIRYNCKPEVVRIILRGKGEPAQP